MKKEKLKVGLLIDDYSVPFWAYKMIEEIKDSNYSEICLVVRNKTGSKKKKVNIKRFWSRRNRLLFDLYLKLEQRLFKPNPNAFELKNLTNLVSCTEILVKPEVKGNYDIIGNEYINQINEHSIDVFIKLGFKNLKGKILNSSKYGVWSYVNGDTKYLRGGPFGVWELFQKRYDTGITLCIYSDEYDDVLILTESFSSTHNLSIIRNKDIVYWKAKSFIPRKLNLLQRVGEKRFFEKVSKNNKNPFFYYNKLYGTPTNLELIKGALLNFLRVLKKRIISYFYFRQYILLFKLENTEKMANSFFKFKRIVPPKDRFWADPFIYQKNGKYYVFIEELLYSDNKGKISVFEMDELGNYTTPQVVLERNYHLSYPLLFEEQGEIFMMPETADNKTIEIYKCVNFPFEWKFEKILMDNVNAVDATLFKHNNKYWMFTNIGFEMGASTQDELYLFYSDNILTNQWVPHPENPIVSDVKSSRPAGNIFTHKNKIYRPAQNCSKHYGYGMQIREITKLNENEYEEKQIQSIYPNWEKDLVSTHTLNHEGRLTFIDAMIKRRK